MLTRQLRELEADQIIERTVYPEVPPKVEYSLSQFGETLKPILIMLQKWGINYFDHISVTKWSSAQQEAPADIPVVASHRQGHG